MNSAVPVAEIDPEQRDPRLASIADAIRKAQCLDREGPYGLFDYSTYGDDVSPFHVRDFRQRGSSTYGDCVFKTSDRDLASAMYDRLTEEHVARAAMNATLKALGLTNPLRYQPVEATDEQRRAARTGELYTSGDMQLIWTNSGDLDLHSGMLMHGLAEPAG